MGNRQLSNIGRLIVSKAFVDNNSELLTYTYPEDNDYSGVVAAYVMFHGNGAIESKLHQLLAETGYTCDTMSGSPSDDNYVIARVSPAYQGSNFLENPALLISGIVGILLIMITGYLIIYNIFQISVIQDIQSYGQLKTLGTTKRQIKKLISKQAMLLSFIGIPFGLLIGFFVGRALVPFLMNGTVYASDAGVKVTANPIIFIGAALFALVTVIISVNKPAKIAVQYRLLKRSAILKMTQQHFKAKRRLIKSLYMEPKFIEWHYQILVGTRNVQFWLLFL